MCRMSLVAAYCSGTVTVWKRRKISSNDSASSTDSHCLTHQNKVPKISPKILDVNTLRWYTLRFVQKKLWGCCCTWAFHGFKIKNQASWRKILMFCSGTRSFCMMTSLKQWWIPFEQLWKFRRVQITYSKSFRIFEANKKSSQLGTSQCHLLQVPAAPPALSAT